MHDNGVFCKLFASHQSTDDKWEMKCRSSDQLPACSSFPDATSSSVKSQTSVPSSVSPKRYFFTQRRKSLKRMSCNFVFQSRLIRGEAFISFGFLAKLRVANSCTKDCELTRRLQSGPNVAIVRRQFSPDDFHVPSSP